MKEKVGQSDVLLGPDMARCRWDWNSGHSQFYKREIESENFKTQYKVKWKFYKWNSKIEAWGFQTPSSNCRQRLWGN